MWRAQSRNVRIRNCMSFAIRNEQRSQISSDRTPLITPYRKQNCNISTATMHLVNRLNFSNRRFGYNQTDYFAVDNAHFRTLRHHTPCTKSLATSRRWYSSVIIARKEFPNGPRLIRVDKSNQHLVPDSPKPIKYILSYLEVEGGRLPKEAIVGWVTSEVHFDDEGNAQIESNEFIENEAFTKVLHSTIKKCLERGIGVTATDYIRSNGDFPRYAGLSTNIIDLAPCTRCAGADTSHIFGSVKLDDNGIPIADTYIPNIAHSALPLPLIETTNINQLLGLVSETGLFRLNDDMESALEDEMQRIRKEHMMEEFPNVSTPIS